jgi:hypothetical protein
MLARRPHAEDHVGPYFLWPRFGAAGHPLLDLYHRAGVGQLAAGLLRPDLTVQVPDFAQVATTIPPWPHPGGPHVDGLTPGEPDGRPGTHLRFGRYLAEHGADALTRMDEVAPGPYPKIELGQPEQVTAPAGSVLFAHYLLAHNIGGHDGEAADERRETVYYRLHASGHRERWREAVTNPLTEFRQ